MPDPSQTTRDETSKPKPLNYHHADNSVPDATFSHVIGGFLLGCGLASVLMTVVYVVTKLLFSTRRTEVELAAPFMMMILMLFVAPFADVILLIMLEVRRKISPNGMYGGLRAAMLWGMGYTMWAPMMYAAANTDTMVFVYSLCIIGLWMLLFPVLAGMNLYRKRRPEAGEPLL